MLYHAPKSNAVFAAVLIVCLQIVLLVIPAHAAAPLLADQIIKSSLPDQYELKYDCTQIDVRGSAVRESELSGFQKTLNWNLRQGILSQSLAQQAMAKAQSSITRVYPARNYSIALSESGGSIFYERDEGRQHQLTLFDSNSNETVTTSYVGNDQIGATAELSPGFDFTMMLPGLPLIGYSNNIKALPSITSITSDTGGNTTSGTYEELTATSPYLWFGGTETAGILAIPTRPSVAHIRKMPNGISQILDSTLYTNSHIVETWIYSDYVWKLGSWIPRHITFTDYDASGATETAPATVCIFDLTSASPNAADPISRGASSLLSRETWVTNRFIGSPIEFLYIPNQGSFQQQMDAARYKAKIARSIAEEGSGHTANGFLVIGSALFASASWLLWRRRTSNTVS